jgi:hypothetical protein
MPAIDTTFRDAFFNTDDFAVSSTYTPVGGAAASIKLIFYNEYESAQLIGNTDSDARDTYALTNESNITGTWINAKLNINSTDYYIKGKEPDGEGFVLLRLSKNSN